jgi:penicillin-binding protein 2
MKDVVSGEDGTASSAFEDWKYKDEIGGKTGTGVVSAGVELEDNAWFVAFAPFDDPEIAVVTYIPNGAAGSNAIPSVKTVIEYYLDKENGVNEYEVPEPNTVLPTREAVTTPPETSAEPSEQPSETAEQPAEN